VLNDSFIHSYIHLITGYKQNYTKNKRRGLLKVFHRNR